ncbi:MAG: cupin domain-containing protein [Mycobacteriales bacterium]|nr:cupin domain-containing protein [Frankia sp.]
MAGIEKKNIDSADETRKFAGHGQLDVVTVGEFTVGRGTFEPGWRWSNDVKPIAGTDSCQSNHKTYVLSGRLRVTMQDGSSAEIGAGDVAIIPAGHDAEVLGDEPCITLELATAAAANYAKPSS